MELKSKTIIITGGTSGIGLEMAQRLVAMGNTVIVTGRNQEKLQQLRESHPQLHAYALEVTDLASVESFYRQVVTDFPKVSVVINNAGVMQAVTFANQPAAGITEEVIVNLAGPILMTQVFLPHLMRQPESAVLNVTSGIAYFPFERAPIYSASKLGLHSYTQSLRKQLRGTSVRVFELAPPRTTQPMFHGTEEDNRRVNRIPEMSVPDVVSAMISGIRKNRLTILPGMSKLLRIVGKVRL